MVMVRVRIGKGREGGAATWTAQSEQALTGSRAHDGLIITESELEEYYVLFRMRRHSTFNVRVVQTLWHLKRVTREGPGKYEIFLLIKGLQ